MSFNFIHFDCDYNISWVDGDDSGNVKFSSLAAKFVSRYFYSFVLVVDKLDLNASPMWIDSSV